MRERRVLWVVLAGLVVGLVAVAGLAAVDDDSDDPPRLPALAAGAAAAEGGVAADSMMRIGPVEYRVAGSLPSLPDRASAWDVGAEVDEAEVRELAVALGIDGAVRTDESGFRVRDDERELFVGLQAGVPWNLGPVAEDCGPDTPVSSDDPEVTRERCAAASSSSVAEAPAGVTEPSAGVAVDEVCPMPDCPPGTACTQVCPTPTEPTPLPEPERPADLPSKAEAERIGLAFLSESGLDVDGAEVRVDDGFSQWIVAAEPRVGGMPTQGFGWSAAVGPKGEIQFANGWLGDVAEGEEYPLAGVDAGIERLKTGAGWSPYPARDLALMESAPECESCEPQVRTITGVRLGLMFSPVWDADGTAAEALLIPSYLFHFEDSDYEEPVIAVADEYLPKPPDVEPQPGPEPMPVEPGGGPGSTGSSGAAGCTGGGSSDGTTVEVCGPSTLAVGEPGNFTLKLTAPEGTFVTAECAAPALVWGDGADDRAVCDIGCAPPPADAPTTTWERSFEHTYAKPGAYQVRATAVACGGGTETPDVVFPVEVVDR